MTIGERASAPDVSPDGHFLTYVTNRAGTSTLRLAHLNGEHELEDERRLVPSAEYEQAYTPRFSPDGRSVAYSAWTRGGYRDIRIVDVSTGSFYELTHDRAIDQHPVWAPDGKTLYFVSDRTGIANVYALRFRDALARPGDERGHGRVHARDLERRPHARVRWISLGWLRPICSASGSRALLGCAGRAGRSRSRGRAELEPRVARRIVQPTAHAQATRLDSGVRSRNLRQCARRSRPAAATPSGCMPSTRPCPFRPAQNGELQASADYAYNRLPFSFRASVFRLAAPRNDYRYGNQRPLTTEHLTGVTSGLSWFAPGEFDGQSVALSYTIADYSRDLPVGTRADPYSLVTIDPAARLPRHPAARLWLQQRARHGLRDQRREGPVPRPRLGRSRPGDR